MSVCAVRSKIILLALIAFGASGCVVSGGSNSNSINPDFSLDPTQEVSRDALVVVIKDPRTKRQLSGLTGPAYNARLAYNDDPVLHRHASRIADDHSLDILSEWPLRNLGVHCFLVDRPDSAILSRLEGDDRVLWVQPFNEFELKSGTAGEFSSARLRETFHQEFNARGRNVRVAVIDTGVDQEHPDLRNASLMVRNFSGQRGEPANEVHGTAVVGLIAARPATEGGVRGIASEAKTHLLRGCWQSEESSGRCNTLTLALALDAAIDLKPDIINLSLSGGRDRVLDALVRRLTESGTLVVAAFDEKRDPLSRFPTPGQGVVYAYGLDRKKDHAPRASDVLIAPKHAVSLSPMSGYDLISGHSIAAPQLTAMAAVLMETYSSDQRQDTITRLNSWLEQHVTKE